MEKILLDQKQIEIFNLKNYDFADIETFIKELNDLEIHVESNCQDDSWANFVGNFQMKFLGIYQLLMSKKLQKNKDDLRKLGRFIQELGKQIENYEETVKKYSNQKEFKQDQKIEDFLKSLIDGMFSKDDE